MVALPDDDAIPLSVIPKDTRQVLDLWIEGCPVKRIAADLHLTYPVASRHIRRGAMLLGINALDRKALWRAYKTYQLRAQSDANPNFCID